MANGDDPQDRQGGGQGSPLGVSLMTLSDPNEAFGRVREQFGQGNAPFPVLDPSALTTDPQSVSTERRQQLVQERADRRVQALEDVMGQAEQQRRRARNRTLLNLAGPTAFQAFSGANIDPGLEERLQQQREAERRAAEMEREVTRQKPQIQLGADIQEAELEAQERQANREAERQAQQQRVEALSQFAGQVRDRSQALLDARLQRLEDQPGTKDLGRVQDVARDSPEAVLNNPQMASRLAQQGGTSASFIQGVAREALRQRQEDGGQVPAAGVDPLIQEFQALERQKQQALDSGEVIDIQERQSLLRESIQLAAEQSISQIGRRLNEGTATRQDLIRGIELAGKAQGAGIQSLSIGGESRSTQEVKNALARGLGSGQAQSGQAQAQQGQQAQGQGQASGFLPPEVDRQLGRAQEVLAGGGGQKQAEQSRPPPTQGASNQTQMSTSRQTGGGGEGQQSPQIQADITLTADELAQASGVGDPTTSTRASVEQLLQQRGVDPSGIPQVEIRAPEGQSRVLAGTDQIASVADRLRGAENRGQILENVVGGAMGAARFVGEAAHSLATMEGAEATPEEARASLRRTFNVRPTDQVRVEQLGSTRGRLVVNGEPRELRPLDDVQAAARTIRGLQSRAQGATQTQ